MLAPSPTVLPNSKSVAAHRSCKLSAGWRLSCFVINSSRAKVASSIAFGSTSLLVMTARSVGHRHGQGRVITCCAEALPSEPWPQTVEDSLATASSLEVLPLNGKGLSAVAMRDIVRGELILQEKPLLTIAQDASWYVAVLQQFEALSAPAKQRVMSLSDAHMFEGKASLAGIVLTNSIACSSAPFDGAVFYTVSRLNHSCVPNCEQTWDNVSCQECIFASGDIRAGEELTISYVEPYLTRLQRADELRRRYKFQCNCLACSSAGGRSDGRRARLCQLLQEMRVPSDGDRGIQVALEVLELFDAEGLNMLAYRVQACMHACKCLLRAGRPEESRPWASKAARYMEMCRGVAQAESLLRRVYPDDP